MGKHRTKHYLVLAGDAWEIEEHYGTALQIARDFADEGYEVTIFTSTMTVQSTMTPKGYELDVHL